MLRFLIVDDAVCKKDLDRFMAKHKTAIKVDIGTDSLTQKLMSLSQKTTTGSKIALNTNSNIDLLNIHEIIRLESKRSYTKFYLSDKRSMTMSKTLREYETTLSQKGFIRVHKSHLINIDHMKCFQKSDSVILMKDGSKIPVSLRKKEFLFKELEKI